MGTSKTNVRLIFWIVLCVSMCVCLCVLIAHFSKPHSQDSFGGKLDPLSCISCIVGWQRLTAPVPVLQWVICVRLFLVYGFCLPASIVRIPGPAKPHRGLSLLLPYSRIWHQGTLVVSLTLNSYLWLSSETLCPEPCLVHFPSDFLDLESCLTFGSNTLALPTTPETSIHYMDKTDDRIF